jgi:hypothetical protein
MKGSCLCGTVSFEITGAIRNARFCHCRNCRKFSGTAYAAWGLIQTAQLIVAPLQNGVTKFNSGGGLRVFCNSCGSPLWYEPANLPQYRGIPLGAIDDGSVPTPEMHVWTKSKVPWVSIPDDVPAHESHPKLSNR